MRPASSISLACTLSTMLFLSNCASSTTKAEHSTDQAVETAVERTEAGFEDAALAPLSDLNLRRQKIPERLDTMISPYEPPPPANCSKIAEEVSALTAILGPDSDVQVEEDAPTLSQRAGEGAGDLTLDTIESTTTGFIPFRGLVRQATGATAHEKRVRKAYEKGLQRRAFLKGAGLSYGCQPPASPLPAPPAESKIEYRKTSPD